MLTAFDLHLLGEGTHRRTWDKLGAHLVTQDGATGVQFAVWAPNASAVSVIGDFNGWDWRRHPMRHLSGGIWATFVPGVGEWEKYKFEVRSRDGHLVQKSDPFGFSFEAPPKTASIVRDISGLSLIHI